MTPEGSSVAEGSLQRMPSRDFTMRADFKQFAAPAEIYGNGFFFLSRPRPRDDGRCANLGRAKITNGAINCEVRYVSDRGGGGKHRHQQPINISLIAVRGFNISSAKAGAVIASTPLPAHLFHHVCKSKIKDRQFGKRLPSPRGSTIVIKLIKVVRWKKCKKWLSEKSA